MAEKIEKMPEATPAVPDRDQTPGTGGQTPPSAAAAQPEFNVPRPEAPPPPSPGATPSPNAAGDAGPPREKPPEKVALKPHPLLDRKQRRASTFGNARTSEQSPLVNILQQHAQVQTRIFKVCMAAFVALILCFVGYFYLDHLRVRRQRQLQLDEIRGALAAVEGTIASAVGYARDQALLQAVNICLRAALVDLGQGEAWQERIKQYQGQLASAPAPGQHFVVPSAIVDMVNIPRGRFNMGRRAKEPGKHEELPRHQVILPYEFWMARTEISNAQFRRFFRQHWTRIPGWEDFRFDYPQQPVAYLDWHAAGEYCRTVTEYEQAAGRLPSGYEYRLPTEAEWEYACRAGTETYYYWGDEFGELGADYANLLDEHARRRLRGDKKEAGMAPRDGFVVTAPVGFYKPNAFGLHDMIGNVWEWCWDWYNPAAYRELYSTAPVQADPIEAVIPRRGKWGSAESVKTTSKVIRGGCWGSGPSEARSAARDSAVPETRNSGIGFRPVLAPKIKIINSGALEDQILKGATMPDLSTPTPAPETAPTPAE